MSLSLEGKAVVVTGGSRGIGKAVAASLARQGANVLFSATREETKQQAESDLKAQGIEATGIVADVSQPDAAASLIDRCVEQHGKIDVLINNAGITRDGLAMRMKDDDWNAVIQVNLNGAFYTSRAASKPMMKARSGRIINVSSIVGLMGNAGQVNYAASKAGLIGLTKSLAKELGPRGVTVNCVAPGFIDTDMTSVLKDETKAVVLQSIPLGRFGKAEEVASLIGFLASDEAAFITGQVLTVDGGMLM